jgi:diaminopimelate decarboxylase
LTSIYGCSTYSRDYLAKDVELPEAHIGDIVIFGHAGSYCSAAHTDFLGFPKAEEYFI